MSIRVHRELIQGTDEWLAARCGLLTASEMKLIITPTLKVASNEKERDHLFELLAQRITGHVEAAYISDDMLRGREDEIIARDVYHRTFAPVEEVGFITRDFGGVVVGYSPDGLVGDDGLIECKSRRQKFQVKTIVCDAVPDDYLIQVQTGLLVTGRKWLDFISYSGGLPMSPIRVYPDRRVHEAILEAAVAFEERLTIAREKYDAALKSRRFIPTERRVEMEMVI